MLLNELEKNARRMLPMHMPGHKRNEAMAEYLRALGARLDITEIEGFDDLHAPGGILAESMRSAAKLWGADKCMYLVNGATAGVLAAVYALAEPNDTAVIARNSHKSVYNALELTGLSAVYALPEYDERLGAYASLRTESVSEALDKAPNARFVMVTSPTYEGAISDIRGICFAAHARGAKVIVDAAHGAHLGLYGAFPAGAVECGADIVIMSLHKTLPSLTQTAVLLINGEKELAERASRALSIFQTSSPSYLLMASIDGCVNLMRERGKALLTGWREALDEFYAGAKRLKRLRARVLSGDEYFTFDPSKIVIDAAGASISGAELARRLIGEHHIELEMASEAYALAMTGAGDTRDTLSKLLEALLKIDDTVNVASALKRPRPELPAALMSIREALASPFEYIPLARCAGLVSADYAWAYPPGVPLIAPGEVIPPSLPDMLSGMRAAGVKTATARGQCGAIAVLKQ